MDKGNEDNELKLHVRYPISSIVLYDGITILHYLLGGFGITLAYSFFDYSFIFGAVYLAFALFQMYVWMPLVVCPSCVYHRMEDGRCISGLNRISMRSADERPLEDFDRRAKGILSPNNLYIAALIVPIIAMVPGLIIDPGMIVLVILISTIVLLVFRIFVIFPKIACVHCMARYRCPNARQMGLSNPTE
ncbi:MAG: hypothetical protein ACMUHY_08195 [Thermoplasmatota archaeon]